ncbi:MAG TPA: 50S ribosomal protein L23 [Candidatus Polarisedimenticolaceae bacterium]|nr:50S ribosomal protein L23 [Candidatus Polarisedimenticolaceae bacterium]
MKLTTQDVIRQPLVTEKSTRARETGAVYCFKADARANKVQIAQAVTELFGVKVEEVRTANVLGKTKRAGRFQGKRADWKKAWVRLAPGEKEIEFFEAS